MKKTKSKYIKGPWRLCAIKNGYRGISSDNGNWWSFAKVAVESNNVPDDVGIANANLIAAAPELLEALEQLSIALEECLMVPANVLPALNSALQVIDKAKGNNL
jgi:hypothetical protein